jgi:hypothetical protein
VYQTRGRVCTSHHAATGDCVCTCVCVNCVQCKGSSSSIRSRSLPDHPPEKRTTVYTMLIHNIKRARQTLLTPLFTRITVNIIRVPARPARVGTYMCMCVGKYKRVRTHTARYSRVTEAHAHEFLYPLLIILLFDYFFFLLLCRDEAAFLLSSRFAFITI